MFKVTVAGEYKYGTSKRETKLETFEETFQVPVKDSEALSIIQNQLLGQRLKSKIKGYKGWRTCQLVNQVELDAKQVKSLKEEDIPKMTLTELNDFAVQNKMKSKPADFGSVEEARLAVQTEIDDKRLGAKIKAEKAEAQAKKKASKPGAKPAKPSAAEFGDV